MSERTEAVRRAVRKVFRDARDKNKWRKIVRFRLWMPVALQILLVATLLWYTNSRFPGFVNTTNVYSDNHFAEMLIKLLGARLGGSGSTAAGAQVVEQFARGHSSGLHAVDGSGNPYHLRAGQ